MGVKTPAAPPAGACVFVGDAKYKRDPGRGHQDDLYQLLAYATATRLPRATLIYAQGPPVTRTHLVVGPDIALDVRHLDLAKPPSEILAQLRDVADRVPTG